MFGGRKLLAVVPARGGSKGLPGKNVRPLGGRPLIAWTVAAGRESRFVDRTVVSTDDDAIAAVALAAGAEVPFRRPAALASDAAASIDVVLHALDELPGYDAVVMLQPTSPLRTAADLDAAIEFWMESGAPACVSVTEAEQTPYWMFTLNEQGRLASVVPGPPPASRRQELPVVYVLNGAIYVADTAWLRAQRSFLGGDTVGYRMPVERSVDIDTLDDFAAAQAALDRQAQPGGGM